MPFRHVESFVGCSRMNGPPVAENSFSILGGSPHLVSSQDHPHL